MVVQRQTPGFLQTTTARARMLATLTNKTLEHFKLADMFNPSPAPAARAHRPLARANKLSRPQNWGQ